MKFFIIADRNERRCCVGYDARGIIKFQKKKFLRTEAVVNQYTLIRIIRDNLHQLNLSLLSTKVYKTVEEIFQKIEIICR